MSTEVDPQHSSPPRSETLIGAGTVLASDIVFSGVLRLNGKVRGNARALDGWSATPVIGESAELI